MGAPLLNSHITLYSFRKKSETAFFPKQEHEEKRVLLLKEGILGYVDLNGCLLALTLNNSAYVSTCNDALVNI